MTGKYKKLLFRPLLLTVISLLSSVLCLSFPIRDLVADYYYLLFVQHLRGLVNSAIPL